jgi:Anti-sigma factor NepR
MHTRKASPPTTPVDVLELKSTPVPKLGHEIRATLRLRLRLIYGEVVDEGVPQRFVEILRRLDDLERPRPQE